MSIILNRILNEAATHEAFIKRLKSKTPLYPEIHWDKQKEVYNGHTIEIVYASTIVRIEREGKWHLVHCVENYMHENRAECIQIVAENIMKHVYAIQLFHKPCELDNMDPNQDISEYDRILKQNNHGS